MVAFNVWFWCWIAVFVGVAGWLWLAGNVVWKVPPRAVVRSRPPRQPARKYQRAMCILAELSEPGLSESGC